MRVLQKSFNLHKANKQRVRNCKAAYSLEFHTVILNSETQSHHLAERIVIGRILPEQGSHL